MAGMDWFRWHHGSVNDPKFQLVARKSKCSLAEVIAVWAVILESASMSDDRGHPGSFDFESIDCALGLDDGKAKEIHSHMISRALLDASSGRVSSWDKRQPKKEDDTSAERKRRQRERDYLESVSPETIKEKSHDVTACHTMSHDVTACHPRVEKRRVDKIKNLHSEKRGEVNGTTVEENTQAQPSRKGIVCGLLRKAGMADAAPHYLTDETWDSLLAKRTDEEIVEVAKAKMAAKPNQRIGLKYIAPALLADPDPITPYARGSPRQTLTESRTETLAGLTGRSHKPPKETPNHDTIESTAVRIAG